VLGGVSVGLTGGSFTGASPSFELLKLKFLRSIDDAFCILVIANFSYLDLDNILINS
jgi:hypothetical protein